MANERTAEEFCAQQLAHRANRIADQLRRLADTVDAHASRVTTVPRPGLTGYAVIASNIQHEVMNTLPNLALDALTTDALDADTARLNGE